jgi:hypothetical protein
MWRFLRSAAKPPASAIVRLLDEKTIQSFHITTCYSSAICLKLAVN